MKIRQRLRHFLSQRSGSLPPASHYSVFQVSNAQDWYHPVILGSGAIGELALQPSTLREAMQILDCLEKDDYVQYLQTYYRAGLERFGEAWRYADIVTVLLAAAKLVQPQHYLEIGVRRGRSMAVVAGTCPQVTIVGFDLWMQNYAGMPNPGPEFVRTELKKVGYSGKLDLVSGDSHITLPEYFRRHTDAYFDLITVDGDHSRSGAEQDLRDVLPRLKIGGVLVFDDISHPGLPHMRKVWQKEVLRNPHLATWEFSELGYGVGLAVRRDP